MTAASPHAIVEASDLVVRALSGGRRRRCRLAVASGTTFRTDLVDVFIGWPTVVTGRALTCALALQASPTKELVTRLPVAAMTTRQRLALRRVEGAAAVDWAGATWPGLRAPLQHLAAGLPHVRADGLTAEALLDRALEAAGRSRLAAAPAILGDLPLAESSTARSVARSALEARLPWSYRRRRRLSPFSIPVTGPSGHSAAGARGAGNDEPPTRRKVASGMPYPEWNVAAGEYRVDHVTVVERDRREPPLSGTCQSSTLTVWFEQPLERRWRHRLEEGTDIDVDGLVDAHGDRVTGFPTAWRVYRDRLRCDRDVACALLVDRSGSVGQQRVLAHELECADALVAAMEEAGERHAVFSFWSDGREHVAVELLRDFDDEPRRRPSQAGLEPTGYTRLGAALRHVTARLLGVDATRRVLLVLSDGVPCDEGYEGEYAYADVVKAVGEADVAGVAVAIMAVGATRRGRLEDLLPMHVHRVVQLPDLAGALASAHRRLVAA